MPISLQNPARKIALAAVCVALAALYLRATFRVWQADRSAAVMSVAGLERAIASEPTNADYHFKLGRLLLYGEQDVPRSVGHYLSAVALNPYNPRQWLDLAALYQITGDQQQQEAVVKEALASEPTNPDVAWEAANFFLLQGHTGDALHEFRVVIEQDPAQARPALLQAWRATRDTEQMLREAVPATARGYGAFLHLLCDMGEWRGAKLVWARALQANLRPAPEEGLAYVDLLIHQREPQAANATWVKLARSNPSIQQRIDPGNLIVNGGFEEDILNAGMDWRYSPTGLASLELDSTEFHGGGRSLKMTFSGNDGGDTGLVQLVPVEPATVYNLSGYLRAQEIYAAHGPQFAVYDAYTNTPLLVTRDAIGTTPWVELGGTFTTGPKTQLVAVKIIRDQGHIRGTAWVDDVRIVPAATR